MKKLGLLIHVLVSLVVGLLVSSNLFGFGFLHKAAWLGAPSFLGAFYSPLSLPWWFLQGRAPGRMYVEAATVGLGVFVFLVVAGRMLLMRNRVKIRGLYGTSRWMNESELRNAGMLSGRYGVILGQTADAQYKHVAGRLPGQVDYRMVRRGSLIWSTSKAKQVLVVAPTGGGKNVGVIVPTLCAWPGSAVVYDVKNENFTLTGGYRKQFFPVYRFAPAEKGSIRFNPLGEIVPGEHEVAAAQNIAEILVNPHGDTDYASKDDAHWKLTAKQLLLGAILHVLHSKKCEEKSLRGVYRLINDPRPLRQIRNVLEDMLDENVHPVASETAANMRNKADNELSGVVSTASSYLQLYQDPIVAENTARSDFRVLDLVRKDRPSTLYICVSPEDAGRLQPLVRLMFQLIAAKLTSGLGAGRWETLLVMDEFPSLGRMQFFEKQLAFFRAYGVRVLLVAQSFSQLFATYGPSTSIIDNCGEIVILGVGNQDAKLVSGYLGSYSLSRESRSRSSSIGSFFEWTHSVNSAEGGRPLMTQDELTGMPYKDFLLLSQGKHPYRGKKVLYYQDPRFSGMVNVEVGGAIEDVRPADERKPLEWNEWLSLWDRNRIEGSALEEPLEGQGKDIELAPLPTGYHDVSEIVESKREVPQKSESTEKTETAVAVTGTDDGSGSRGEEHLEEDPGQEEGVDDEEIKARRAIALPPIPAEELF